MPTSLGLLLLKPVSYFASACFQEQPAKGAHPISVSEMLHQVRDDRGIGNPVNLSVIQNKKESHATGAISVADLLKNARFSEKPSLINGKHENKAGRINSADDLPSGLAQRVPKGD